MTLQDEVQHFLSRSKRPGRLLALPAERLAAAATRRGSRVAPANPSSDPGRAFHRFLRGMPLCADLSNDDISAIVGSCCVETFAAGQVPVPVLSVLSHLWLSPPARMCLSLLPLGPDARWGAGGPAARAVELRTGEALGILSALAGRPKTSDVCTGPFGCELGVVPTWALAPYLLDHVAAVVSRIPTTRIEPSNPEKSDLTLSASSPSSSPSVAKKPVRGGGKSIRHDNDNSGKDDEDLEDEICLMLELLPPNRLSAFINQMRRSALTVCATVLGAWSARSRHRRHVLQECERCLKRNLAAAFERWHQGATDLKAECMVDRMQMLAQELQQARDKLRQKEEEEDRQEEMLRVLEEEGDRQQEMLRVLRLQLDEERGKSDSTRHKQMGERMSEAHLREKTDVGLQELELMMQKVQGVIETVEGLLAVVLKLGPSSAVARNAFATGFWNREIEDDEDAARMKTVFECGQIEYGSATKGEQPGNTRESLRGNGRSRPTNPFATPESMATPHNSSLSPAPGREQTERGTLRQAERKDQTDEAAKGACERGKSDESDSAHCESAALSRVAIQKDHTVTTKMQRKELNEQDSDRRQQAPIEARDVGEVESAGKGDAGRGEPRLGVRNTNNWQTLSSRLLSHSPSRNTLVDGTKQVDRHLREAPSKGTKAHVMTLTGGSGEICKGRPKLMGTSSPLLQPLENAHGADFDSRHCEDKRHEEGEKEVAHNTAMRVTGEGEGAVTVGGSGCRRGDRAVALTRDIFVDASGDSPNLSPVLRNASDHSTPTVQSAGTSDSISPALQAKGDVFCGPTKSPTVSHLERASWEEGERSAAYRMQGLNGSQNIQRWETIERQGCMDQMNTEDLDTLGQSVAYKPRIEIPSHPAFTEDGHDSTERMQIQGDLEEMWTQSGVGSRGIREGSGIRANGLGVENGASGRCDGGDQIEGDATGGNRVNKGAQQVRQGGRQGVDFTKFYQKRTPVDADTETQMMWSNMCIPFAPASPYSVPVTPLTLGPIREDVMSPLTRGRGDAPFFPEDHFEGDAAAEVVGFGVRLVSGPLEHSGAEKGKPAEGKEGSPSLGRSGEKRVSDKMESEKISAAELGDECRGQMQLGEGRKREDDFSREIKSRNGAAQGKSVGVSGRKTCGGERSSEGGREGILQPGRNLREAPSTRASRLKQSAPAKKRTEKEQYLHDVAEQIANKLMSKGVKSRTLSDDLIAEEASRTKLFLKMHPCEG